MAWRRAAAHAPSGVSQQVRRAAHAVAAAVEHVGVDHGGLDVVVAEELLDSPDVIAVGEQVGGERSAESVKGGWLGHPAWSTADRKARWRGRSAARASGGVRLR